MELDYAGLLSKLVELQGQEVNVGVYPAVAGGRAPLVVGFDGVLSGGWTPEDTDVFLTVGGSTSITIREDWFERAQLTYESDVRQRVDFTRGGLLVVVTAGRAQADA